MQFKLGDRVKVSVEVNQDKELGSRGLASRYGHIVSCYPVAELVEVEFHDFSANIPAKYLTLVEASKT